MRMKPQPVTPTRIIPQGADRRRERMSYWIETHRWFCRESRNYIGPYSWRDRLCWPIAWLRFMYFTAKDRSRMRRVCRGGRDARTSDGDGQ
jgi:hypothetical protein